MTNLQLSRNIYADTKPHFQILDGLRGVAAILVVVFHIFEAFATSHLDQIINHGYLAVDFFFILSGFVMGYAYDDRWNKMKVKDFLKRRLIRLHPMVVMGSLIGGLMFYTQVCNVWDVSSISIGALLFATLLGALLIPAPPSTEIRGLGEMFPLNGPSWSLFFEYIGNLLYVFLLRKLPTKILGLVVAAGAASLIRFAIWGPLGDICAGYSLTGTEFIAGISRLLFSFTAGLFLHRLFKPISVRGTFWAGTAILIVLLSLPRIGGADHLWWNGLYEVCCTLIIFPLVVFFAASEKPAGKAMTAICQFLGKLSYPLYMVHYPFIYLYYAWVKNNHYSFSESIWGAVAVLAGSLLLAYLCLKFYDIPLRKYLSNQFLLREKKKN